MKTFIGKNFMLENKAAKTLYHDYASAMPIIDYHCHINPAEIVDNRRYDNLTQVWLGGDHYKWRLMRACGEDEELITGSGSDYDKFMAFARVIPKAVGNPVYTWTHLELKRYFGCDLVLSPDTALDIWNICNSKLAESNLSVRGIIKRSNVKVIATTDDPIDSLSLHKALAEDSTFKTKVVPTFRPDKVINIEKPGFTEYVQRLADVSGVAVGSLNSLYTALVKRLDLFDEMGCRASDHGLDYVPFASNFDADTAEYDAAAIFEKAISGEALSGADIERYKTAVLLFLGRQYAKRGWVMQLHYGALRNVNPALYEARGADVGNDAISSFECSHNIASLLAELERTGELPKTILYSLNPNDDAMLATIAGCFTGKGIVGKVQHGSAWWFNDSKPGMEQQLTSLASRGLLGGFVGMLTDSRSFLSYTRHEYFRRALCNLIGRWVETGEYPYDIKTLGAIVQDISHNNAARYFGF